MEAAALKELEVAQGNDAMFMALLHACLAARGVPAPSGEAALALEEALRFEMVQAWCQMHGYLSGVHNRLLNYMHDDPASLRQAMTARVCGQVRRALEDLAVGEEVG
jgi:hypothetical protein